MKIECPLCRHEFEWKPPEGTEVYKMILSGNIDEDTKPKRYLVSCPKCEKKFSVCV